MSDGKKREREKKVVASCIIEPLVASNFPNYEQMIIFKLSVEEVRMLYILLSHKSTIDYICHFICCGSDNPGRWRRTLRSASQRRHTLPSCRSLHVSLQLAVFTLYCSLHYRGAGWTVFFSSSSAPLLLIYSRSSYGSE